MEEPNWLWPREPLIRYRRKMCASPGKNDDPTRKFSLIPIVYIPLVSNSPPVDIGSVRTNRKFQINVTESLLRADYFHKVSNTTPPTIMAALRTILNVTRSTSRRKSAVKINEKNGPVLAMGITTETLPKSSA